MKRSRKRGREKEEVEMVERKKKRAGLSLSCCLFSFVSLESFPLPPLEETAAPATHNRSLLTH